MSGNDKNMKARLEQSGDEHDTTTESEFLIDQGLKMEIIYLSALVCIFSDNVSDITAKICCLPQLFSSMVGTSNASTIKRLIEWN